MMYLQLRTLHFDPKVMSNHHHQYWSSPINNFVNVSASPFSNIMGYTGTHGSGSYAEKSCLSKEGKQALCHYLNVENQIFESLV